MATAETRSKVSKSHMTMSAKGDASIKKESSTQVASKYIESNKDSNTATAFK